MTTIRIFEQGSNPSEAPLHAKGWVYRMRANSSSNGGEAPGSSDGREARQKREPDNPNGGEAPDGSNDAMFCRGQAGEIPRGRRISPVPYGPAVALRSLPSVALSSTAAVESYSSRQTQDSEGTSAKITVSVRSPKRMRGNYTRGLQRLVKFGYMEVGQSGWF